MKHILFLAATIAAFGQLQTGGAVQSSGVRNPTGSTSTSPISLSNLTVQQVQATYTCGNTAAATLAVTDNSGFPVTVWDVNPTVFTNSNLDTSRSNTILSNGGLTRTVEIGLRATQLGNDGNLYSRSLHASTNHTLTVTCSGATPATANFTTLNIPLGDTSPMPARFNASGFAGLDAPSINWNNLTVPYIDPQRGIMLLPGHQIQRFGLWLLDQLGSSVYDPNSTWTNPSNILSGVTGTLASVSNSMNPVYVSLNRSPLQADGSKDISGFSNGISITDLRINVCGWGDQAAGQDRTVGIALYQHDGNIIGNEITVVLPQGSGSVVCQTASAQSTWPAAPYGAWGVVPNHNMVFPWGATATAVSGAVTSTTSVPNAAGIFNTDMLAGDKVWDSTGSQFCTLAAPPTSATTLSCVESLGFSGHAIQAANFGFRVRKTTATGTVNVSVFYDEAYDSAGIPGAAADGATRNCSSNTLTISVNAAGNPATGRTARLCILYGQTGNTLHAVFEDTGETRLLGEMQVIFGAGFDPYGNLPTPANPWDPTDPKTFYAFAPVDADHSANGIVKSVYRSDGRAFVPAYTTDWLTGGTVTTKDTNTYSCNAGEQNSGNICYSLLGGQTIRQICGSSDSRFSGTGLFGPDASRGGAIAGGSFISVWSGGAAGQDLIAGLCAISLSTATVTSIWDTYSSPGARWGMNHTVDGRVAGNYVAMTLNAPGHNGSGVAWGGPWIMPGTFVCLATPSTPTDMNCTGGTWSSTLNLTQNGTNNDLYSCPSSVCGSTVANTILLRFGHEPQSTHAATAEATALPCDSPNTGSTCSQLSSIQVGDGMTNNAAFVSEELQALAVQKNSTTDVAVWALRGVQIGGRNAWTGITVAAAPNPLGGPANPCVFAGAMYWFDATGSDTTVRSDDCNLVVGAHNDASTIGATAGHYSASGSQNVKGNNPSSATGFSVAASAAQGYPDWQGAQSCEAGGNIEEYPSVPQLVASTSEQVWYADFRAYQGGAFVTSNGGTQNISITLTAISGNLYRFASGCAYNVKRDLMEAWAGRLVLQDVSGPSSIINTTDTGKYCIVYINGECRSGSTNGQIYVAIAGLTTSSNAWTNQMDSLIPAIVPAAPIGDWAVQWDMTKADPTGVNWRRLTKGFGSTGRLFTTWNWRPLPDAGWGFIPATFPSGQLGMTWLAKYPAWPGYDSVVRNSYENIPITAPSALFAEVRFGYEENGTNSQFYCMTRAEACITIASPTTTTPFNFLSDGHSGISCTGGCTIQVPAMSGRELWYQVFSSPDNVTYTAVGAPAAVAVP